MQRVAIGEILGAHGIKGELRVAPLTDFPERFYELEQVHLGDENRPRLVQSVRKHDRFFLVKLEGIKSEEEAQRLGGTYFSLPRHLLVDLPEGHFYLWEIEGLKVFGTCGQYLGVVEEVLSRPANDVYLVRSEDGRELLIPALRDVVVEVDVKEGRMVVARGPSLDWREDS